MMAKWTKGFLHRAINIVQLVPLSFRRELQLVRELHKFLPSLQYYYMGYYIHSCPKMRYKARISPSFLLCPETYTWQPIVDCIEKIERHGFCRLNENLSLKDENDVTNYEPVSKHCKSS